MNDNEKVLKLRENFPFLKNNIIYFDSASTSLKPIEMIQEEQRYYKEMSFNVLRSSNELTRKLNVEFIKATENIANFINANKEEIVFTYNATYASNEIAKSIENKLDFEDEIILSDLEHSSAFLPWLNISLIKKLTIKYYKVNSNGFIDLEHLKSIITTKTKVMIFSSTFNTIGSSQDVEKIVQYLKTKNIISIVDGTQSIGHIKVDVKRWDCDFMFFSAHKSFGPTGLGIWYAKKEILENINPIFLGGGMNSKYSIEDFHTKPLPYKMYAGTPNISGILSFSKSLDLLNKVDLFWIEKYTNKLKKRLEDSITNKNIIFLNKDISAPIFLFKIDGVDSRFVEYFFSLKKILMRSGLFCVKTLNSFIKDKTGSLRVSLHFYNTEQEIDILSDLLNKTLNEEYNLLKDNEFIKDCVLD